MGPHQPGSILGPGAIRVEPLEKRRLDAVSAIQAASFPSAGWSISESDLFRPDYRYSVALLNQDLPQAQDCVAGCIGCWMADNELHVVTLAVIPDLRGAGIGLRLMVHELEAGLRWGARRASLEVRRDNIPARRLYEGLGFRPTGIRPRYYLDTGDDALVMWLDDLDSPEWHFRMRRANARLGIG